MDACSPSAATLTLSAQGGNIGRQGLVAGALALTLVALLFSVAPFRARGMVLAILSGIAMVLLFLSENHLQPTISAKLSVVPDLISVSAGLGFLAGDGDPGGGCAAPQRGLDCGWLIQLTGRSGRARPRRCNVLVATIRAACQQTV